MSRKTVRVADLAREAESDLDETLVALWDAGVENVAAPNDLIPRSQISAARAAMGLFGAREQGNVQYWMDVSGLSPEQLAERMSTVGVKLDQRARRIPKNSLRRFRLMFAIDEASDKTVAVAAFESSNLVLVDEGQTEELQHVRVAQHRLGWPGLKDGKLIGRRRRNGKAALEMASDDLPFQFAGAPAPGNRLVEVVATGLDLVDLGHSR